jgi:3-deoxy-D-manno-octulosonate 8-phosphate phosphatase (KDO 8-P phosphatase)
MIATKTLTLSERCKAIKLIAMDVDGVLTQGGIIHDGTGKEWKVFHVRDGSVLKKLNKFGIATAIITGRSSVVVEYRAKELEIDMVFQGVSNKAKALEEIISSTGISAQEIAYIGDDLADISIMKSCGLAASPNDACFEVRNCANFVSKNPGGKSALRDLVEIILKVQGKWNHLCASHLN